MNRADRRARRPGHTRITEIPARAVRPEPPRSPTPAPAQIARSMHVSAFPPPPATALAIKARYPNDVYLRWRLEYPYRDPIDEPPYQMRLTEAPAGARAICLLDARGEPIIRVPMEEAGRLYRPVFYRKMHRDHTPGADTVVDATVFGRIREAGGQFEGIFLVARGGRITDADPRHIDYVMAQLQHDRAG